MTITRGLVPDEHATDHLLVLPRSRGAALPPLEELAAAWFPGAAWERPPADVSAARPMAGARFRGVAPREALAPGVLRLGAEHVATGPFPLDPAQAAALGVAAGAGETWVLGRADGGTAVRPAVPPPPDDRDGLGRAFPGGLPAGEELAVVRWAVAVARKVGGTVVVDGRIPLVPDPQGSVDLSLWSAHPLDAPGALAVLRTLVPTAETVQEAVAPGGSPVYAVVGATTYDGALVLEGGRQDAVPQALAGRDWREHGPFRHRVRWVPVDPYELAVEQPSGVHAIARGRVRASAARLATVLQGRLGGTLVDDGGFVVTAREVEERLDPSGTGTRVWV